MSTPNESPTQGHSNRYTIIFTLILCSICAIVLAAMASGLKDTQQSAILLDRSKQMLMSAHIIDAAGKFQVRTPDGKWSEAICDEKGQLVPVSAAPVAMDAQITQIYQSRVHAVFTDNSGKLMSAKSLGINPQSFFDENQKYGFSQLEHKLLYVILAPEATDPLKGPYDGFIIPVNGFGLWGPIYGYLGLEKDAMTVLGISWYQHGETPGLGANISEPSWQKQFPGKIIFQKDRSGAVDPASSPIGLVVIKGKVQEVYGEDPRADNSVDGMTGATITGNGVNGAYKNVLEAYRPFLIQAHQASGVQP